MSTSFRRYLLLIAVGALAFRLLPLPARYLELDSSIYIQAAGDYAAALASGAWLRQPLTGEYYAAVDYWPPLFPALAGFLASLGPRPGQAAILVAGLAGWLALFPAAFLAGRLWGPRAGVLTAALVGFSPLLAWYARVPRSESLFFLLYACSLAGLLGARGPLGALAGGACLGLAYATRFDALLLVPGALAAAWWMCPEDRSARARRLGLWGLGLLLAAAPYLGYLAWLNGGTPTLITPKKAIYDTLEGLWALQPGEDMFTYTVRFGPPGLTQVNPDDPEVRALFARKVDQGLGTLVLHAGKSLPESLAAASLNLMPLLLLPALLALASDRRSVPLLALYAPFPFYAFLTSWDPNPRYHACLALPTLLLAGRGLDLLWSGEARLPARAQTAVSWAVVALAAASWWVPRAPHFDARGVVDPWLLAGAGPSWLALASAALGVAVAALVSRWRPPAVAGLAGATAAMALVFHYVRFLPGGGFLANLAPAVLVGLGLLPALLAAFMPLPGRDWQPRAARWILAAFGLVALQTLASLQALDLAAGRLSHSEAVASWLEAHPEVRTVASSNNVDVFRTGREWVPAPLWREPEKDLPRLRPDAVVMAIPSGQHPDPGPDLALAARVLDSGLYEPALEAPAPGGLGREWRIYMREDLGP